jgi:hypothetical protein
MSSGPWFGRELGKGVRSAADAVHIWHDSMMPRREWTY